MCLMALGLGLSDRFPLVLASNRDEYHHRPTAALDWWTAEEGRLPVLGGRDLEHGGSWLALGAGGRLALLTNLRRSRPAHPNSPSRGGLVRDWAAGDAVAADWWRAIDAPAYNPFNLVVADLRHGRWHAASSDDRAMTALGPGVHGLSNAPLGTPWPKVAALEQRVREAVDAPGVDELAWRLFAALLDDRPADDHLLPDTGIPASLERALSSAFIHLPERGYGTRCSTLVIAEQEAGGHLRTHVIERCFGADGRALPRLRRVALDGWPARGGLDPARHPVREAELTGFSAR